MRAPYKGVLSITCVKVYGDRTDRDGEGAHGSACVADLGYGHSFPCECSHGVLLPRR